MVEHHLSDPFVEKTKHLVTPRGCSVAAVVVAGRLQIVATGSNCSP